MDNNLQNITRKHKDRATRTPLKTGDKLGSSGRVGSSRSTCSNHRVTSCCKPGDKSWILKFIKCYKNHYRCHTVLVDYVGIFFYMRQYFWPHTVLFLSNTYLSINISTIIKLFGRKHIKQILHQNIRNCLYFVCLFAHYVYTNSFYLYIIVHGTDVLRKDWRYQRGNQKP
jgi:hypothetical protein